jgi:cyanophycin synthetase
VEITHKPSQRVTIGYHFFSGPNILAPKSTVQVTLRIGNWLDRDLIQIAPEYRDTLLAYFPSLKDDEEVTRIFQDGDNVIGQTFRLSIKACLGILGVRDPLIGSLVSSGSDECHFFFGYEQSNTAVLLGQFAMRVTQDLVIRFIDPNFSKSVNLNFHQDCSAFLAEAKKLDLNNYQRPLVEIAEEREIPWQLTATSFLIFGQGKHQRKINRGFTDRTSFFGVQVCTDKQLTNLILRKTGLPVPIQTVVESKQEAVHAANKIGYPVVLKPLNADFGNGVSVGLKNDASVISGFELAKKFSRAAIVEKFIPGEDYRILVIDGSVVSVAKRVPAHVIGDGKQSISDLVGQENRRRENDYVLPWALQPILLDAGALQHLRNNEMSPTTVPAPGQQVFLRYNANLATGGSMIDITELAHPKVKEMACDAAEAIGLDVAGIDYLTPNISLPYSEVGGSICEVNCTPGYNYHNRPPGVRDYRHITVPYMKYLMPVGTTGRIPTIAIMTEHGKTDAIVEAILLSSGYAPGRATDKDGFFARQKVRRPRAGRLWIIQNLFRAKRVDSAIISSSRENIRKEGLGFDSCHICALQGEGEAPPTDSRFRSSDQVLLSNTRDAIVLTADNPNYDPITFAAIGKKIYLVALDPTPETNASDLTDNVTQIALNEDNSAVIRTCDTSSTIVESEVLNGLGEMPSTEDILFAIAIAHAFGLNKEAITEGLKNISFA